jgi:hypothetical protein
MGSEYGEALLNADEIRMKIVLFGMDSPQEPAAARRRFAMPG